MKYLLMAMCLSGIVGGVILIVLGLVNNIGSSVGLGCFLTSCSGLCTWLTARLYRRESKGHKAP